MKRQSAGFTLLEVLIAMLILAIGLLGMASLMITSLQNNQGAYTRAQATVLAYDIVERMRANRPQAELDSSPYVLASGSPAASAKDCQQNGCSPSEMAAWDMAQWWADMQTSIPGATATVTQITGRSYEINLSWKETSSARGAGTTPDTLTYKLRTDL
ncbi:type IV pilus modification protein PilV [Pseudomonas sp. PDM18]|uniref:type IV pilus modification protein PilV n=1 Tax=Pseudomonas sp. PDM18 TaxID=2769253 RepID=UPI001785979E|nr:type IV pilus modification protein PilV [Pseudomonas sp. PDM18]MBD9676889.1 type IV pilus modification protein PilV [Pseudomonas sp. PDM18]